MISLIFILIDTIKYVIKRNFDNDFDNEFLVNVKQSCLNDSLKISPNFKLNKCCLYKNTSCENCFYFFNNKDCFFNEIYFIGPSFYHKYENDKKIVLITRLIHYLYYLGNIDYGHIQSLWYNFDYSKDELNEIYEIVNFFMEKYEHVWIGKDKHYENVNIHKKCNDIENLYFFSKKYLIKFKKMSYIYDMLYSNNELTYEINSFTKLKSNFKSRKNFLFSPIDEQNYKDKPILYHDLEFSYYFKDLTAYFNNVHPINFYTNNNIFYFDKYKLTYNNYNKFQFDFDFYSKDQYVNEYETIYFIEYASFQFFFEHGKIYNEKKFKNIQLCKKNLTTVNKMNRLLANFNFELSKLINNEFNQNYFLCFEVNNGKMLKKCEIVYKDSKHSNFIDIEFKSYGSYDYFIDRFLGNKSEYEKYLDDFDNYLYFNETSFSVKSLTPDVILDVMEVKYHKYFRLNSNIILILEKNMSFLSQMELKKYQIFKKINNYFLYNN